MGCVAFHIGFLKKESACCESLSHASGVPAPFHKGALRAVPADNFARWLSAIRYFPDPPGIVTEQNGERKHGHCVRIDSGGTPPLAREPFLCSPGGGENKCFANKYRDNPYYIQKIRGNSNLSVIFTGGVVKTTKIGIEIMAMFVYNYLIVVQGT